LLLPEDVRGVGGVPRIGIATVLEIDEGYDGIDTGVLAPDEEGCLAVGQGGERRGRGGGVAPRRMKRTRAPANGCPNWFVTVATTTWLVPTTARVCLGARVTALATGVSQVTVTELEGEAGGADAVTTDVPVTGDPKENTALPSEVGALPVVLPAPVTVKLTAVLSPTGIPPASVTTATTVAFPLTGASPPAAWVAPNRPRVTWLGGPAQLAAALPVIEPDPTTTVAVMDDWPGVEELKEKVAAPEASLVRLPDVAPGPVTVKATVAPWTGLPWRSNTVAATLAVWPVEL
jgi:hypothetical protein